MHVLTLENIAKSYSDKTLFDDINFSINDTDKIGLIGVNGTGKSTLLKIIAGVEYPDTGQILTMKNIRIGYLSQSPDFDLDATVIEQVFQGDSDILQLVRDYETVTEDLEKTPDDKTLIDKQLDLMNKMNAKNAWELESQVKMVLTKLGVHDFKAKIGTLSGGQKKRVALAQALITPCDLLILDEPTNHMDNETIDWMESYLKQRKGALIMITHDRYFLDNVSNKTIELDHGDLFSYDGNYTLFVEKKIERQQMAESMERKRQNLYRQELAWIKRGAKARSTKQKARIQRFESLQEESYLRQDGEVEISVAHSRLGKKVIELQNICKSFDDKKIIDDFSYTLLPDDRIGIVGKNGAGKSTLLNLITGKLRPDSGSIDIGSTVKIGYFSQESEALDESMRAIEFIREFGENVTTSDGTKITAGQMMERFLFDKDLQWTYINRLSGGEKRRLYLLSILMQAPNILILDEPTNDLDIDTLKVLEMYLDEFRGAVISVSHDRYFLDRTCQRIFAFTGGGHVQEHTGNYSDYAAYKKEMEDETNKQAPAMDKSKVSRPEEDSTSHKKVKFSYNEQREFAMIEEEIESLESKLSKIDAEMATVSTDFVRLGELTTQKDEIEEALLEKMERFEYLSDLNDQIMAQKKK
ncbi:ABC-F family ATP-binding cassette domain-containing protein [Fusibacter sp. JL216-2]|uniref:ABC-F family ATP-binding cassette domain-containing protein n=1 Tax=Fusibacter sp. JL216-2 TaxID=3071453 RepID=UPI003D358B88